jgi:hypothetical protein
VAIECSGQTQTVGFDASDDLGDSLGAVLGVTRILAFRAVGQEEVAADD